MDPCRLRFTPVRVSTLGVIVSLTRQLYAYEHALNSRPLDDEDDPRRWLVVGIDQSGRVLELVVLVFDGGGELLIHAMKARAQFLDELL